MGISLTITILQRPANMAQTATRLHLPRRASTPSNNCKTNQQAQDTAARKDGPAAEKNPNGMNVAIRLAGKSTR